MKILHIAEFGIRKTGVGTVVERIHFEQIQLGHDVRIATTSQNLAYQHLKLYDVSKPSNLYTLLDTWIPDVVLFHSIWCMPYIKMGKFLRKKKIPYAVMMHGANSDYNNKQNHLKKEIANFLFFNNFLRQAATVIFLSNSEYKRCVSANINARHDILPNGCDTANIDLSSKFLHNPIVITYLGRLALETKGLNFLFKAISILREKGIKDVKFQFYGNENDIDIIEIKKQISLLSDVASFEGPAYGEKKGEVLYNSDIFILTSPSEGMPMGVLEALTYGVPCILTPGTNMADDVVAAGAGWRTELDSHAIADTILLAVTELRKDSTKYIKSAYNMSKLYDWKVIAKDSIKLMENIIRLNN